MCISPLYSLQLFVKLYLALGYTYCGYSTPGRILGGILIR